MIKEAPTQERVMAEASAHAKEILKESGVLLAIEEFKELAKKTKNPFAGVKVKEWGEEEEYTYGILGKGACGVVLEWDIKERPYDGTQEELLRAQEGWLLPGEERHWKRHPRKVTEWKGISIKADGRDESITIRSGDYRKLKFLDWRNMSTLIEALALAIDEPGHYLTDDGELKECCNMARLTCL